MSDSASSAGIGGSVATPLVSPVSAGFVATQFLGAFNDNYFKQIVLLTCVSQVSRGGLDRQPWALAAFALPFVLLSGLGGFLSDRFSRQRVIIWCKVGEIGVMGASLAVLLIPGLTAATQLLLLIGVLALLAGQSALFGPAKYGVLPELFQEQHLLPINGMVQMTTFLAIIFGTVCAGIALDLLGRSLWQGSLIAVGIAVAGTLTSFLIPPTRPAQPDLKLRWENLGMPAATRTLLLGDPGLLRAMVVSTTFWFIGGVTQPAVNLLGSSVMGLSDTGTSLLTAGMGVGIAVGCLLVGVAGGRAGRQWAIGGAWGIVVSFTAIGLLSSGLIPIPQQPETATSILEAAFDAGPLEWSLRLWMVLLGCAAGIFVVPVQVFLQQAPPGDQKGRVLGVMNLLNWCGILLSAVFLGLMNISLKAIFGPADAVGMTWLTFFCLAALMVPVAILYRPSD